MAGGWNPADENCILVINFTQINDDDVMFSHSMDRMIATGSQI